MKDRQVRGRKRTGEPEEARELSLAGLGGLEEDLEEQGAAPKVELLSFTAGEELYALDVSEVREIIRLQPVTSVPRCPEYILGVISLRGEIVPVIDLRARLSLGPGARETEPMIIVVRWRDEPVGLLVQDINGIVRVAETDVETTPEVVSPDKAEFLKGVVRSGDRLAAILNLEPLLETGGDLEGGGPRAGGPGKGGQT